MLYTFSRIWETTSCKKFKCDLLQPDLEDEILKQVQHDRSI